MLIASLVLLFLAGLLMGLAYFSVSPALSQIFLFRRLSLDSWPC